MCQTGYILALIGAIGLFVLSLGTIMKNGVLFGLAIFLILCIILSCWLSDMGAWRRAKKHYAGSPTEDIPVGKEYTVLSCYKDGPEMSVLVLKDRYGNFKMFRTTFESIKGISIKSKMIMEKTAFRGKTPVFYHEGE